MNSPREIELEIALRESVKLQAHYARLLNIWDGGKRTVFKDSEEWIKRLRETGTLNKLKVTAATES